MINFLIYMDDINLFAKIEKELKTLIQTIKICIQDIRMQFGGKKYAMLRMKNSKREITEEIELPK